MKQSDGQVVCRTLPDMRELCTHTSQSAPSSTYLLWQMLLFSKTTPSTGASSAAAGLCFAQREAILGTAGQDGGCVAIWRPDWTQSNALIDAFGPTSRDKRETFFKLFPVCVYVRFGNISISFLYSL